MLRKKVIDNHETFTRIWAQASEFAESPPGKC
jgi:hypothetical protein